jgi:hypothetical protein
MATVFVSNPGNLSDPEKLKRMNEFVNDMEMINGSWGPVGTQYFVRDFISFENLFHGWHHLLFFTNNFHHILSNIYGGYLILRRR